jgi:hypothetical protein
VAGVFLPVIVQRIMDGVDILIGRGGAMRGQIVLIERIARYPNV